MISRRMALGSFDGLVSLWDMDAMACYKCADRCLTSVRAIDLAPNGSAVIGTWALNPSITSVFFHQSILLRVAL